PDRLLANFRKEAGLQSNAEHYGGWEGNTISGHTLGHYLNALSMMYQTTGKKEFLDRVNYIVDQLDECQKATGNGYIGAFHDGKRIFEEEIAKGNIRSQGFNLNGLWSPIYTMHKVMDGLYHAYHYCGNEKALQVEMRFADWLGGIMKNLSDEQVQQVLNCEFGGVNEALAELYAATGDEKYLNLAKVFYHKDILNPLAQGVDILSGKHANTQFPKLIGLARIYELTGNEMDRKTTEFFWNRVVHHHSYVTGGNGDHEYFGPADSLNDRLSNETTETCNVYNMLKLSEHLFEWAGTPDVADFYERALFNQILSSQNPVDGRVIYNLSLEMGGHKEYQDPEWFTCCIGTGMENHSKYGKNIYYHNNEALYVTQFIASELNWKDKGVKIIQQTSYPEEQSTSLTIECSQPEKFLLKVRYPSWAQKGMSVLVNGKKRNLDAQPGSFVIVGEKWENGDKVEIKLPFSLRLESMPDNASRVAVFYGPLVLAGDLGPEMGDSTHDPMYVPIIMTKDQNPENWIVPVTGEVNTFKTSNVGKPRDVVLKPFYQYYNRDYSIYWDMYSAEEWSNYQTQYQAEQAKRKELESRTIDVFRMGEMQPERDHQFRDDKSWVGEHKTKKFREVERNGSMSFRMNVLKDKPVSLVLEYWGGFSGMKTFDILVEGQVIATQDLDKITGSKFVYVTYDLPDELIQNKKAIEVKIVPKKGHRAGPVFTAMTIKH
ncbi:MAG TPA: glycoside hydrolase family 127 protein, partial [Prolixibacteraceae bacterium]|nr:glycoside hydrolase family 127 protein [Prolixibacteraceae bacterium]